jgi:hypothetical protein
MGHIALGCIAVFVYTGLGVMMSQIVNLNTFANGHEAALSWINQQLSKLGMVVKPSFDLQAARSAHTDCSCPHHGTSQCNCQIVVLLVYRDDEGPISLVLHSQDEYTYLSMMGVPDVSRDDTLAGKIFKTLRYQNLQTT